MPFYNCSCPASHQINMCNSRFTSEQDFFVIPRKYDTREQIKWRKQATNIAWKLFFGISWPYNPLGWAKQNAECDLQLWQAGCALSDHLPMLFSSLFTALSSYAIWRKTIRTGWSAAMQTCAVVWCLFQSKERGSWVPGDCSEWHRLGSGARHCSWI